MKTEVILLTVGLALVGASAAEGQQVRESGTGNGLGHQGDLQQLTQSGCGNANQTAEMVAGTINLYSQLQVIDNVAGNYLAEVSGSHVNVHGNYTAYWVIGDSLLSTQDNGPHVFGQVSDSPGSLPTTYGPWASLCVK